MPLSELSASKTELTSYAPGDVILGKYTLESLLGEGGMGSVWRARNTALDAPVAIKLIRADLNRDTLGVRLLQEARAAAKLGHPAIVRVFDVGQTERGDPFIVMELLEGHSFSALLTSGRVPPIQAVQTLLPIADALARAHAKGIVHRDLKPDNVFLVTDEERVQPKLVDFGIVKVEQREGGSHLTQVGTVLGSPEYMSPEQARGVDDVDHRTDVWSFAVMLYEAVTGRLPFAGGNYNALMRAIVEETPPSPRELAGADAALSSIIERGLTKDRDQRFRGMGEFGRVLAFWLVEQGVHEDICGVALESKWLNRSSDPAQARTSLYSAHDLNIPPYSGVRGRTPRPSPIGPTAQAPVSAPPGKDRRALLAIGIAVVVALATTLIFALTGPSEDEAEAVHSASVPVATPVAPEMPAAKPPPVVAPEPVPSPTPAPSPTPPPPVAKSAAVTSHKPAAPPRKASAEKPVSAAPSAPPAKKSAPGHDLLSPY